jgi:hypothetical protein
MFVINNNEIKFVMVLEKRLIWVIFAIDLLDRRPRLISY